MKLKQYPLYCDNITKEYFLVGDSFNCELCTEKLEKYIVVYEAWGKKEAYNLLMCESCSSTYKDTQPYNTKRLAFIVDEIEKSFIPILLQSPILINSRGDLSVFDVANKQISDEEIIDNMVHACRESFAGMKIGSNEVLSDRMIESEQDLHNEFGQILLSKPVVQDFDTPRLEKKEETEALK